MADSAFQVQYRQEFIAQFEQGQSWLRSICTTEAVIKGNQAMFLVAGSGAWTVSLSASRSSAVAAKDQASGVADCQRAHACSPPPSIRIAWK
jgi:hypothetical protein